ALITKEVEDFSIEDYLDVINRRKWIVIIITLIIMIGGLFYSNSKTRIYSSTCEIYTNTEAKKGIFGSEDLMAVANLANITTNSEEMISKLVNNPDNIEAAFDSLTPEEQQKGFDNHANQSNVDVRELNKGTNIYCIQVKCMDPAVAAKFANLLSEVYFKKEAEIYNKYSRRAEILVAEEIEKILDEIENVRDKLVFLKQKTGIYSLDNDISARVNDKYSIESKIQEASVELTALENQYNEIQAQIKSLPSTVKVNTTQSVSTVEAIAGRIDQLTTEKEALLEKFTPNSPEVIEISKKIEFERKKLKEAEKSGQYNSNTYTITDNPKIQELKSQLVSLEIEIKGKKASIEKLNEYSRENNESLKNIPMEESELAKISEQYQILKDNLGILQSNYYRLTFNSSSDYNIGRVLSKAMPNPSPVEPNMPKAFIIFLIAGFIVGGFAALLADNLDNVIYDDSSMKKVTSLPCLAKIPNIQDAGKLQIGKLSGHSNFLEAFRIFRNNISLTEVLSSTSGEYRNKSFAITGPDVKQGKSTASANLAIAMALDGKKVLLVDADLRKPNIAKFFNVPNNVGYSTLVKGTTTIEESVKASGVDNLDLLTSGPLPPNPTEFLNSEDNRVIVEKLQEMYDVVIFDTSPCSFISDTQIVTTFVDAVVMVVTIKTTRIPTVRTALEQMALVKAPLLGYILNRVETGKNSNHNYYNYYYYASDDKD
ncbi:MAG: polysaccharide biosynthesis tyrosine autokinase, partial [Armatimonadetes bacterium]|nr:polysaccharide biosynthesis tyrosine autokinase [Candidatus Hippobium faecium]